ncbi:uncharacterized protein LOC131950518 [Physella acuta]|uniref:uncharacterized protein LOC131950518 n=1 Tax=Physella acuta TaxID=109671 RepID=UPI0027DCD56F|nr:uncharacterized protein LOC131950518 [Physella acuta]
MSECTQGLPRSRFTTTTPTSSGTRNPKLATASTTPPAYNSTSTERTTTTTRPTTTTEGVILVLGNIDLDDLDIPDDNTNFDLAYSKGLAKDATSTFNMDGVQDDIDTGTSREYNQCKISENIGSALTCPATRGKPGSRATFYLLCYTGFFAIECRCLPGHFYNRCLQSCDVNANFRKCPLVH